MTEFSPLIIGAMRLGNWGAGFSQKALQQFVEGCIELGLNTFDHADIYGDYTTEGDFGQLLKETPSLRTKMKLITKCGIRMVCNNRPENLIKSYDTSKDYIIGSVEKSLVQLGTDHIDLLLLHRPDFLLDPHEVAGCFDSLQRSGKVLAFGVSNFSPAKYELLNSFFPLVTNQVEISLLKRNAFTDGTLDQCIRHKIRPMAWSPVGGGALFKDSEDPVMKRIHKAGKELCEKYNCELDQLLYAWLLLHPAQIIPVLGTSNVERVRSAHEALSLRLAREDWYLLWTAATGQEVE
ncbi:hypothetical protein FNH22_21410 [Fulvivirga sp. M361]|uniref:aldo/keto reductase n=1 Tax=Fulvivirga sp. M361 TaxID=2594266 RepID=UPI001179FF30|nr:aldo/keto reductase [Fulvivirga sp. M361]TRX53070.1 hypothetical protein FNH22_21410 [Fulvivirga sp. M361]